MFVVGIVLGDKSLKCRITKRMYRNEKQWLEHAWLQWCSATVLKLSYLGAALREERCERVSRSCSTFCAQLPS